MRGTSSFSGFTNESRMVDLVMLDVGLLWRGLRRAGGLMGRRAHAYADLD